MARRTRQSFQKVEKLTSQIQVLGHYNQNNDNIPITVANTMGLRATTWPEPMMEAQNQSKLAAISGTLKTETPQLNWSYLVVWTKERFEVNCYKSSVELLSDHEALEHSIKKDRSNKTYGARLTRWLNRLAHSIDKKRKHIATNVS